MRAPCRSPFVAIARTAGALTNPLEHKLECSYGDFRAAAGGRFVDGSLQHRKDNWDVVELHTGGRRTTQWTSLHAKPWFQLPQPHLTKTWV
jgi:hypothetical protein